VNIMAQPVASEKVVSVKTYLLTFLSLLGLTLLTTLLGFIDMGPLNTIVAVVIAAIKASLIAAFFMHALYESKLIRVVLAGGVIWLLILISLTISDYISRYWM
jgi:cytochrome c oxidase subunit 4